jgi:hypothetical protein
MIEQPEEALRLAGVLELLWLDGQTPRKAAAELRRLHAANAELLEALKEAAFAIEYWGSYASKYFQEKHDLQSDINSARSAIAKAEGK